MLRFQRRELVRCGRDELSSVPCWSSRARRARLCSWRLQRFTARSHSRLLRSWERPMASCGFHGGAAQHTWCGSNEWTVVRHRRIWRYNGTQHLRSVWPQDKRMAIYLSDEHPKKQRRRRRPQRSALRRRRVRRRVETLLELSWVLQSKLKRMGSNGRNEHAEEWSGSGCGRWALVRHRRTRRAARAEKCGMF